jgi:hypothetical protein
MAWLQDQMQARQQEAIGRLDKFSERYMHMADGRIRDVFSGEMLTPEQMNARLGVVRKNEIGATQQWMQNRLDKARKNSKWDYAKGKREMGDLEMPAEMANTEKMRDLEAFKNKAKQSGVFVHNGTLGFGKNSWVNTVLGIRPDMSDDALERRYENAGSALDGSPLWNN